MKRLEVWATTDEDRFQVGDINVTGHSDKVIEDIVEDLQGLVHYLDLHCEVVDEEKETAERIERWKQKNRKEREK